MPTAPQGDIDDDNSGSDRGSHTGDFNLELTAEEMQARQLDAQGHDGDGNGEEVRRFVALISRTAIDALVFHRPCLPLKPLLLKPWPCLPLPLTTRSPPGRWNELQTSRRMTGWESKCSMPIRRGGWRRLEKSETRSMIRMGCCVPPMQSSVVNIGATTHPYFKAETGLGKIRDAPLSYKQNLLKWRYEGGILC